MSESWLVSSILSVLLEASEGAYGSKDGGGELAAGREKGENKGGGEGK